MNEAQVAGVEHLARNLQRLGRQSARPVNRISQDRMTRGGEMNADLMRASRLQGDRDERRVPEPLEHAVMRHRASSPLTGGRDPAPAFAGVPHEIGVESSRSGEVSLHERHVLPLDSVPAEELLKTVKRLPVARENDRAGSIPVDAVNDEGDRPAPVAMVQVVEHPGEQCVALTLGGGDRQEPGGLLYDQEVGVFDEYPEPRPDVMAGGPARMKRDGRVFGDLFSWFVAGRSGHVHPSRAHRFARRASREMEASRKGDVEPHGSRGRARRPET